MVPDRFLSTTEPSYSINAVLEYRSVGIHRLRGRPDDTLHQRELGKGE